MARGGWAVAVALAAGAALGVGIQQGLALAAGLVAYALVGVVVLVLHQREARHTARLLARIAQTAQALDRGELQATGGAPGSLEAAVTTLANRLSATVPAAALVGVAAEEMGRAGD